MVNLTLDDKALRPLVQQVVAAVIEQLDAGQAAFGDRLAYSEPEAAQLIGCARHVLRDARLRGELQGCRVGRGVRYERQELLAFLQRSREPGKYKTQ